MSGFHRFDRFLGRIYALIGNAIGLVIGLFALAISADLFLRLFGIGNLPGVQEIIEYLLFIGVFVGAPWVLRMGAHIRVDLVVSNLSFVVAKRLDRALDLLGLVVCGLLVWFGAVNLRDAYAFNALQMKYFNIPEWWLLSVFVLSFSLLAFEFLSRILRGGAAPETRSNDSGGL